MKQANYLIYSCVLVLFVVICGFTLGAQNPKCSDTDNDVYDGRIGQLKGKVTILNHPELKQTPASGFYLVFQRADCKKCLIATRTNSEGAYDLLLSEGRYKVIAREIRCDYGGTGCDCFDLLASDQSRFVNISKSPNATQFDIKIALPKK